LLGGYVSLLCCVGEVAGELPLILVGLVDGTLAMAEILKASFHLAPEIQVTDIGRHIKGKTSESSAQTVAVAYTSTFVAFNTSSTMQELCVS
jgi:hypothetical protein